MDKTIFSTFSCFHQKNKLSTLPKEISENTRSEVISHLISGKSYPEISKITGVSTSSISNIVKDLKKSFGKDDIDLLMLSDLLSENQLNKIFIDKDETIPQDSKSVYEWHPIYSF